MMPRVLTAPPTAKSAILKPSKWVEKRGRKPMTEEQKKKRVEEMKKEKEEEKKRKEKKYKKKHIKKYNFQKRKATVIFVLIKRFNVSFLEF